MASVCDPYAFNSRGSTDERISRSGSDLAFAGQWLRSRPDQRKCFRETLPHLGAGVFA
jgi:hypothetical protein